MGRAGGAEEGGEGGEEGGGEEGLQEGVGGVEEGRGVESEHEQGTKALHRASKNPPSHGPQVRKFK